MYIQLHVQTGSVATSNTYRFYPAFTSRSFRSSYLNRFFLSKATGVEKLLEHIACCGLHVYARAVFLRSNKFSTTAYRVELALAVASTIHQGVPVRSLPVGPVGKNKHFSRDPVCYHLLNEMVAKIDMFGSCTVTVILGELQCGLVITIQGDRE